MIVVDANVIAYLLIEGPETEAVEGTAKDLVLGMEYLVDGADVMALVESSSCSAYACEYVALARTLGGPMLTYDGQVLAAFPDHAATPKSYLSG